jgi:hypothetical protein
MRRRRRRWIERSIGVASIMRSLPSREVHSKCSVLKALTTQHGKKANWVLPEPAEVKNQVPHITNVSFR